MSASNQIFALTAGGNVVDGEGNCAGGVNVRREYVRGECPPVVTEVMQLTSHMTAAVVIGVARHSTRARLPPGACTCTPIWHNFYLHNYTYVYLQWAVADWQ